MPLPSLWTDRPTTSTAPAEPPAETDVVVIGAGITGLTTALQLSRAGRRVVVLEARGVATGTTGRSTAKVSLLQGTRLSSVSRLHPHRVLQEYVTGNLEAQAWVTEFCAQHGVVTERRDAVSYATTERGAARLRRELDLARSVGLDATWDDELPLPYDVAGAVRLPDQVQVDPVALCDALASEAVRRGAVIVEGARVHRVTGKDPVTVDSSAGTVTAGTVVIATGMPVLDRGGFFARMVPQRSYTLALRVPGAPPVDAMYLSVDQPSRSLRDAPPPRTAGDPDDADRVLLVGGAGHVTGRVRSPRARLDELREWSAQHFPGAEETHAWSAQDYSPAHELPFAGPLLPGQEHLLVAGGFSKWGMTNGPAAALALTARICGGRMDWSHAFEPWSTRELSGAPRFLETNATVGLRMSTGWLRPLVEHDASGGGDVRYEGARPPVAVGEDDAGCTHRVSGVCPHLGGIVNWNDAERSWDCPLHGSRFAADGEVLEGPAVQDLPPR